MRKIVYFVLENIALMPKMRLRQFAIARYVACSQAAPPGLES